MKKKKTLKIKGVWARNLAPLSIINTTPSMSTKSKLTRIYFILCILLHAKYVNLAE